MHAGTYSAELGRKHVSDMFYEGELEKEIRSRAKDQEWKFKTNEDAEKYIVMIEEERSSTLYSHNPSPTCTQKGVTYLLLKCICICTVAHNLYFTAASLHLLLG